MCQGRSFRQETPLQGWRNGRVIRARIWELASARLKPASPTNFTGWQNRPQLHEWHFPRSGTSEFVNSITDHEFAWPHGPIRPTIDGFANPDYKSSTRPYREA